MWFHLKRVGFTAGGVYSFPGAAITNDHNKQQTWLLQTTEIYALTVLRPKFQNHGVCKAIQMVTGIPWCSMACGRNTPLQSLPPSSHLQLCVSLSSPFLSLLNLSLPFSSKVTCHWNYRPTQIIQGTLSILRYSITSAKTFWLNKVTVTGSKGWDMDTSFGGHRSTHYKALSPWLNSEVFLFKSFQACLQSVLLINTACGIRK